MKALASSLSVARPDRAMPPPLAGSLAASRRTPERAERDVAISPAMAISPAECVTRRRASWRGMAAETIEIARHAHLEFRFRAPVHLLVLRESGARFDRDGVVESLPRCAPCDHQRKLMLVPAGHEYAEETHGLARLACFYFEPLLLPLGADESLAPRLFFDDAELVKTALKLKAALDVSLADDTKYCEALGVVLAHDLARLAPDARRSARKFRGGLAGWQQQTVARHIEERLAEHVSLASLAALVRLSPYHFSRAFKQSFGMPPHRFHTHRRIERAKALLGNPQVSATEVGMAVGFSSASAFTMSFRKVTGITPSDYRRALV